MKNFNIIESKDGYKILNIQDEDKKININIGSKYNEKREIEKFLNNIKAYNQNDTYFVIGVGTGNYIRELIKLKYMDTKIVVIEPDTKLIEIVTKNMLIKDIVENPDVCIMTSKEEISRYILKEIDEINLSRTKIVCSCNYEKIYSNEIKDIYGCIKEAIASVAIKRNTNLNFSEKWFTSMLSNVKKIGVSRNIVEYRGKYINKPAIIVSAGPSLSKNIELLKDCDNAIIISGGRTLKPLLNLGIDPHFTAITDGGDISYQLVEDYIGKTQSSLIYFEGTEKRIVENHKYNKIMFWNNSFINNIYGGERINLCMGGSVAHTQVGFALHMGCNPIIFIGQDLAYTEDKTHDECANTPGENVEAEKIEKIDDMYIRDIHGNKVRSTIVLNSFKNEFEKIIKLHPDTKFIDATEGGAYIEGTEIKKLSEVISEFKEPLNFKKEEVIVNKKNIENTIKELKKNIDRIKFVSKCSKEAVELLNLYLEKYKMGYSVKSSTILNIDKKIKNIDKTILKEIKQIDIISSVLYKTILNVMNDLKYINNSEDQEEVKVNKTIKKNIKMYKGILEVIDNTLPEIKSTYKDMIGYN